MVKGRDAAEVTSAQFGHVWSGSVRVVSLPLCETISISQSNGQTSSPLPCADLLPDCRLLVRNRPIP